MLGLVGQLLPIGLAAAISTVPITATLLILLSSRRSIAALPFLIGYVLGTFFAVGLALLLAQALPERRLRQPDPITAIVEILIGVGLIVLGVHGWRKRHRSSQPAPTPRWASAIDALSPGRAFLLGFVIDLRPKSLLLAAVVGLQVHAGDGRPAAAVVLIVSYVIIATSTVTVPIVLTLVDPNRMEPRLMAASQLLSAQAAAVSTVVLILIGAVVLGAGLQDF